jgi:hypothetical protein
MELDCPSCFRVTILSVEAQKRIASDLRAQSVAAREIVNCRCGAGQFVLGLARAPRAGRS